MKPARLVALGLALAASAAEARPLSDAQVRQRIIGESIATFQGACPCPYSKVKDRRGRWVRCGSHSGYGQAGSDLRCYPRDVSDTDVEAWRNDHDPRR